MQAKRTPVELGTKMTNLEKIIESYHVLFLIKFLGLFEFQRCQIVSLEEKKL